jgi:hypothetical protein
MGVERASLVPRLILHSAAKIPKSPKLIEAISLAYLQSTPFLI